VSAVILKLDRDRNLLNADVPWTQQFDWKSLEPVHKHEHKYEPRIIHEVSEKYTLNDKISWSQKKNHYKMKMIPIVSKKVESSKKTQGKPETLTGVFINYVYTWSR